MNFFFLIFFISFFISTIFYLLSRSAIFVGVNTDPEKFVKIISNDKKWKFFSDMHFILTKDHLRCLMLDFYIILLLLVKLITNKKDFKLILILGIFCNFLSAILVFLITVNYFDYNTAFLVFLLYLFCIWPYMIILYGGHQILGLLTFLFGIYFHQLINLEINFFTNIFFYFGSGIFFGLMNYSSSSARKFIFLFYISFLYSCGLDYHFISNELIDQFFLLNIYIKILFILSVLSIFPFFSFLLFLLPKTIIWFFLDKITIFKDKINKIFNLIRISLKMIIFNLIIFLILVILNVNLLNYLFLLLGLISVIIILNHPNYKLNFRMYYDSWHVMEMLERKHNYTYGKINVYFKKIYNTEFTLGNEGIKWYPLFLSRLVPFHFYFYIITSFLLIYLFYLQKNYDGLICLFILIFISILPYVYNEFTSGEKTCRTLFPGFVTLLLPIAFCIFNFFQYDGIFANYTIYFIYLIVFSMVLFNIFILIYDILPSRLVLSRLLIFLKQKDLTKIYTPNTPFNENYMINFSLNNKSIEVIFINTIDEIDNGYLFIPPLNNKSMENIGYMNVDYNDIDKSILDLIEDKKNSEKLIVKYKTYGLSKYWQLFVQVPSVRDLILRDIKSKDKDLSFAWIFKI